MNKNNITENIPLLLSVFSACILSVSVIYDYGYFLFLGFNFSEAPTTISDHIQSSLIWLPTIAGIIFGVTFIEFFFRRIEKGQTEQEIIETSPAPKFYKIIRSFPNYLFILLCFMVPILHIYGIKIPLQGWQWSTVVIWVFIHLWFFGHPNIMEKTSMSFYFASRYLPVFCLLIGFQGAIAAERDVNNDDYYKITMGDKCMKVILLRTFDDYFLVYHPESSMHEFINREPIIRFIKIKSNKKVSKDALDGAPAT